MGFNIFPWLRRVRRGIVRSGFATRVVFYYPGEDGTYLDGAWVRIYDSGIVDINHPREQVTTHIQNVEIVWKDNRQERGERAFVLHSFENRASKAQKENVTVEETTPRE